jgi:tetratricopeptide (TPR) repeat protein
MRDDFLRSIVDTLSKRVGMRCSNPDCRLPTSGPCNESLKAVNIGVASHITAASPGGPRYDPNQTIDERRSIENGIWLCQSCSKLIDSDPNRFTVKKLHEWKILAEERARSSIESPKSKKDIFKSSITLDQHTKILTNILNRLDEKDCLKNELQAKEQIVTELSVKLRETEAELSMLKKGKSHGREMDALKALLQGDFDRARNLYESLRAKERKREAEHAVTCYTLGNIHYLQLNFNSALEAYIRATELDKNNSKYIKEVGKIYGMLAEFQKALEYFERALKTDQNNYGEVNIEVANDMNFIGLSYLGIGDYRKGIEYFENSIRIASSAVGQNRPEVGMKYTNIGVAWRNLEEYDKALEAYEKSLEINMVALGENHPEVAKVWNNIANVLMAQGELEKAIVLFQKALDSDIKTFGIENPEVAKRWHNLGLCYAQIGNRKLAIEFLEKALQSDIRVFGENHPEVSQDYYAIGIAWIKSGDARSSIPFFEKSLSLDLKRYGDKDPMLVRRFGYLGQAWLELGNIPKAMEYMSHAMAITDGKLHERPRSFTFEK